MTMCSCIAVVRRLPRATDSSFTGTPARDWSIDIALANNATPYAITGKVVDKAGNMSAVSTALNITVDTTSAE